MKFTAMLTGYRLLDVRDLEDKLNKFLFQKNTLIQAKVYDGYLDRRINALQIVINERTCHVK